MKSQTVVLSNPNQVLLKMDKYNSEFAQKLTPEVKSFLCASELSYVQSLNENEIKNRFLQTRYELKKQLSLFLKKCPSEIEIEITEHGKPRIKNDHQKIDFNISHSGKAFIIAYSEGEQKIGVDIQFRHVNLSNRNSILKRFFNPEEAELISNLKTEEKKDKAFIYLWTAKEALVKSIGGSFLLDSKKFCYQINTMNSSLEIPEEYSEYIISLAKNGILLNQWGQ